VELVLLIPAMLVAEATISFIGLGFAEPVASWGTMLQEASNITNMTHAPWMLAPAGALFFVVLCVQLVAGGRAATFATLATVRRSSPLPATRPVASTMIDGL
jgi:ABC-type dipeptide/oligopeptide/nickel transport system permease subunit